MKLRIVYIFLSTLIFIGCSKDDSCNWVGDYTLIGENSCELDPIVFIEELRITAIDNDSILINGGLRVSFNECQATTGNNILTLNGDNLESKIILSTGECLAKYKRN